MEHMSCQVTFKILTLPGGFFSPRKCTSQKFYYYLEILLSSRGLSAVLLRGQGSDFPLVRLNCLFINYESAFPNPARRSESDRGRWLCPTRHKPSRLFEALCQRGPKVWCLHSLETPLSLDLASTSFASCQSGEQKSIFNDSLAPRSTNRTIAVKQGGFIRLHPLNGNRLFFQL